MADGGYQDNPDVVMPYRKPRDGSELTDWQKTWNILRDYRRAAHTLAATASGIAFLRNLTITG